MDKVAATTSVTFHGILIGGHVASDYTLSASRLPNKTATSLVVDTVGFLLLRYTTPLDCATATLSTMGIHLDSVTSLKHV
jgi:hypothetical protein